MHKNILRVCYRSNNDDDYKEFLYNCASNCYIFSNIYKCKLFILINTNKLPKALVSKLRFLLSSIFYHSSEAYYLHRKTLHRQ